MLPYLLQLLSFSGNLTVLVPLVPCFCIGRDLVWLATKWGEKHTTLNSWDPWHLRVGLGVKYNRSKVNTSWNSLSAIFTVIKSERAWTLNYWPWMLYSLFCTLMLVYHYQKIYCWHNFPKSFEKLPFCSLLWFLQLPGWLYFYMFINIYTCTYLSVFYELPSAHCT